MLGSLTTPNGLSPGSPERYWACIRYLSACTATSDLRICTPFMDLDPHQKGILSDDFGVAISTAWLVERLGGVTDIVDGRRFMINMGIRRGATSTRLAKVGTGKCPDFVLKDVSGRLHVLECKGTQSGTGYLARAMRIGHEQKQGIRIARPLRGESLVIGLSLAGEGEDFETELVVKDPDVEPLTVINKSDAPRAATVLTRLSLARALNLSGFARTAFEIAWPEDLKQDTAEAELLSPAERKALSVAPGERQARWREELSAGFTSQSRRTAQDHVIQRMTFDLPAVKLDSGLTVDRVTVHRGMRRDLLSVLANAGDDLRNVAIESLSGLAVEGDPVTFTEDERSCRLDYRGLFYSEMLFE